MFEELTVQPKPRPLRCIGRLSRNCYISKGKLVSQNTFTLLKRKSQLTLEDLIADAEYDIDNLELGNYEEGIYEIVCSEGSRDWETGCCDGIELTLVPYKEA